MNAKANKVVKFREWWRPLAAETAGEYLESATDAPFMMGTAELRPQERNLIPAVTHTHGSARTGLPVVRNTSFNLSSEPIGFTPTDAVRTCISSGRDALGTGYDRVEK